MSGLGVTGQVGVEEVAGSNADHPNGDSEEANLLANSAPGFARQGSEITPNFLAEFHTAANPKGNQQPITLKELEDVLKNGIPVDPKKECALVEVKGASPELYRSNDGSLHIINRGKNELHLFKGSESRRIQRGDKVLKVYGGRYIEMEGPNPETGLLEKYTLETKLADVLQKGDVIISNNGQSIKVKRVDSGTNAAGGVGEVRKFIPALGAQGITLGLSVEHQDELKFDNKTSCTLEHPYVHCLGTTSKVLDVSKGIVRDSYVTLDAAFAPVALKLKAPPYFQNTRASVYSCLGGSFQKVDESIIQKLALGWQVKEKNAEGLTLERSSILPAWTLTALQRDKINKANKKAGDLDTLVLKATDITDIVDWNMAYDQIEVGSQVLSVDYSKNTVVFKGNRRGEVTIPVKDDEDLILSLIPDKVVEVDTSSYEKRVRNAKPSKQAEVRAQVINKVDLTTNEEKTVDLNGITSDSCFSALKDCFKPDTPLEYTEYDHTGYEVVTMKPRTGWNHPRSEFWNTYRSAGVIPPIYGGGTVVLRDMREECHDLELDSPQIEGLKKGDKILEKQADPQNTTKEKIGILVQRKIKESKESEINESTESKEITHTYHTIFVPKSFAGQLNVGDVIGNFDDVSNPTKYTISRGLLEFDLDNLAKDLNQTQVVTTKGARLAWNVIPVCGIALSKLFCGTSGREAQVVNPADDVTVQLKNAVRHQFSLFADDQVVTPTEASWEPYKDTVFLQATLNTLDKTGKPLSQDKGGKKPALQTYSFNKEDLYELMLRNLKLYLGVEEIPERGEIRKEIKGHDPIIINFATPNENNFPLESADPLQVFYAARLFILLQEREALEKKISNLLAKYPVTNDVSELLVKDDAEDKIRQSSVVKGIRQRQAEASQTNKTAATCTDGIASCFSFISSVTGLVLTSNAAQLGVATGVGTGISVCGASIMAYLVLNTISRIKMFGAIANSSGLPEIDEMIAAVKQWEELNQAVLELCGKNSPLPDFLKFPAELDARIKKAWSVVLPEEKLKTNIDWLLGTKDKVDEKTEGNIVLYCLNNAGHMIDDPVSNQKNQRTYQVLENLWDKCLDELKDLAPGHLSRIHLFLLDKLNLAKEWRNTCFNDTCELAEKPKDVDQKHSDPGKKSWSSAALGDLTQMIIILEMAAQRVFERIPQQNQVGKTIVHAPQIIPQVVGEVTVPPASCWQRNAPDCCVPYSSYTFLRKQLAEQNAAHDQNLKRMQQQGYAPVMGLPGSSPGLGLETKAVGASGFATTISARLLTQAGTGSAQKPKTAKAGEQKEMLKSPSGAAGSSRVDSFSVNDSVDPKVAPDIFDTQASEPAQLRL